MPSWAATAFTAPSRKMVWYRWVRSYEVTNSTSTVSGVTGIGNTCVSNQITSSVWTHWANEVITLGTGDAFDTYYHQSVDANYVWESWTDGVTGTNQTLAPPQVVQPVRLTPAQEAEARRIEEEFRQEMLEKQQKQEAANIRARELLLGHLSNEQRAQLDKNSFFLVRGGKTGKWYRIHSYRVTGNIEEIDGKGETVQKLCAHLDNAANAPIFDHFLAQKMMLECAEEEFLKVANVHWRR